MNRIRNRVLGAATIALATGALILAPAAGASATERMSGPFSTLAKCNAERNLYHQDPTVEPVGGCFQLFPGEWWFQWKYT